MQRTITRISQYRNTATGETAPAHWVGTTSDGRPLYTPIEGWEPIDRDGAAVEIECDEDGNWIG